MAVAAGAVAGAALVAAAGEAVALGVAVVAAADLEAAMGAVEVRHGACVWRCVNRMLPACMGAHAWRLVFYEQVLRLCETCIAF